MAEGSFADALNQQIANEFAASQQYVGAAVYYDSETLPRLAAFFYRQAVEERNHAMMMVQYLASLFHPDTPNDTAPAGYNDPAVPDGLPDSPLEPTPSDTGFRWG